MHKVLVACEFSGVVRSAFREAGFDAWSCDLLPAEDGSEFHYQCDIREVLYDNWTLLIAHPPCTRLCNSGVRWLHKPPVGKTKEQIWDELKRGAEFFSMFINATHIKHRCVENPIMHKYAKGLIENYKDPTQCVQPWEFGDPVSKRTCLWLYNLPRLLPKVLFKPEDVEQSIYLASPSKDRWKERSRFFPGIAKAMAERWGTYLKEVYA